MEASVCPRHISDLLQCQHRAPGNGCRWKDHWSRAISSTHTAYFTSGELTQDLIWEQYPYPVSLSRLLAGNSASMIFEPNTATKLPEPLAPQPNVLIDKTGSTNGFGSYVAFVPGRRLGIVILANKNYPIPARVTAAFEILTRLDKMES